MSTKKLHQPVLGYDSMGHRLTDLLQAYPSLCTGLGCTLVGRERRFYLHCTNSIDICKVLKTDKAAQNIQETVIITSIWQSSSDTI